MLKDQTLCQFLGIKVKRGKPFIITHNGNQIYFEDFEGYWSKKEYNDTRGNTIYFENSDGYYHEDSEGAWWKREYDAEGNLTYFENFKGSWRKHKCYPKNNQTYFEDSSGRIYREVSEGYIKDDRSKELTMDEISEKFGIPVTQLKIKKD